MVNFKGPDHREVWIPPAKRSQVPVFEAADNSGVYTTSLKTLLPMAIAQETPIKSNCFIEIEILTYLFPR
jgi:hypothetical protein